MRIRNDVTISKNKTSKNKPWLVRWWGKYDLDIETQKRYSKSFTTKKQAEKFVEKVKIDIEEGIDIENYNLTLEQLCNKYINAYKATLKYSSYISYESTVKRLKKYFTSSRHIKHIRKEDAQSFISNLKLETTGGKASDSTRSRYLRQSRRIFNVAKEWGYIRNNPFDGIKLGKINKDNWHALTIEEFNLVLNSVDKYARVTEKNRKAGLLRILRLKTFYSVMYYCGLRFGEAVNLLWDSANIDFVNNQINLINRPAKQDMPLFSIKDYECRSIPVPDKVMTMLLKLQEESEEGNPFVFLSKENYERVINTWHNYLKNKGQDWDNKKLIGNARRDFKWFVKKAGIETNDKLNIHSLRKGYGTNMANLGIPVHTLKDLMGHSTVTTTMEYYVKSIDENRRAAVEKLNAVAIL
jgi:integrase